MPEPWSRRLWNSSRLSIPDPSGSPTHHSVSVQSGSVRLCYQTQQDVRWWPGGVEDRKGRDGRGQEGAEAATAPLMMRTRPIGGVSATVTVAVSGPAVTRRYFRPRLPSAGGGGVGGEGGEDMSAPGPALCAGGVATREGLAAATTSPRRQSHMESRDGQSSREEDSWD